MKAVADLFDLFVIFRITFFSVFARTKILVSIVLLSIDLFQPVFCAKESYMVFIAI